MDEKVAKKHHVQNYTAFDRALVSAAQNKSLVTIEYLGLEEATIVVTPISIDKYFIEVENDDGERIWLNKQMMALARIEK